MTADRRAEPLEPTTGHGVSAPDACSVVWDGADDASVYGTAAPARFWVALEQDGPWGRNAATQSHLPIEIGRVLERRCTQLGGRLTLIRRPGPHADQHRDPRRCYLAWSGPEPFLLVFDVADAPAAVLEIDLAPLARGDRAAVLAALPAARPAPPVMLVCTNGRRDVCCAVRGRPVAAAGHRAYPGRVWECSHTGGHRFSPTGVLLPWGRNLARLTEATIADVVEAADRGALPDAMTGPWHDRGASALRERGQAAESAVRHLIGETDLQALDAPPDRDRAHDRAHDRERDGVRVVHRDGRTWLVQLEVVVGEPRENSCGTAAFPSRSWATSVTQV